MTVKLAYNELTQFCDGNGAPYAGAQLFTYSAGSSTKLNTYKTIAGSAANSNPIILDANGRIPFAIWLTSGSSYKFVLAPANDTDPPVSPIWTLDDITGINDSSSNIDQWQVGPTPTYISATSFSLVGDQTATFEIGRRIKTSNTGGTVYSTITNSAFGAVTTVTVTNDSGTLDSGLSAVYYSLLTASNQSIPSIVLGDKTYTGNQTITGNVGITGTTTVTSTDAGATAGPTIVLDRNSASPDTSDLLGNILFKGRDSGGGTDTYAEIVPEILDKTAASEDARINLKTVVSGTLANRVHIGQGIFSVGVTGGDMGSNTANFSNYYKNGTVFPVVGNEIVGFHAFGGLNVTQNATTYMVPTVGTAVNATEQRGRLYPAHPCTVYELHVHLSAAVPVGQSIVATVRRNGVDTSITCTISAGQTDGSDVVNTADFGTMEPLTIKLVTSATFTSTIDVTATLRAKYFGTAIDCGFGVPFSNDGSTPGASAYSVGYGSSSEASTEANMEAPIPACFAKTLRVQLGSWTLTSGVVARRNTVSVLRAANTTAIGSQTDMAVFSEGDFYNLRYLGTEGSTTGSGSVALFQPSNGGIYAGPCSPLIFSSTVHAQNTTRFMAGYGAVASATESDVAFVPPACTAVRLRVGSSATVPSGQTATFTLRKNGIDQSLTAQLTNGGGRTASDTVNTVTFNGTTDTLSLKVVSSATAGTLSYNASLEFIP